MIFGSIFNGIMARVQNLRAQEQQAKAFDMLKANESELRNLFNSEYYKDYIERADVQHLINSAKELQKENTQLLKKRATIMGGTDEFIGANQKNNNQNMASLFGNLAAQGTTWKDNIYNNYLNRNSDFTNKRFGAYTNMANLFQNSSANALSEAGKGFVHIDNALANIGSNFLKTKFNF
ncbi:MAG: hypothetical protein IJ341_01290 [Bacteroidales bacterium]|nr:hypothetical protein [Bacteroidales bacterium]